ncbi:molybdopterin-dependent oxidoreductase [Halosolutus gelatinilyticus]|uniref:molybdopterin-dependent oxidoreductase n=1 Tax=Halosolutus gelatinilyticus TaxID=2931975 RepID=UPI001FF11C20|nr:molybdopterin-dependent oxidoreductase [Halosolutus gelatinilyticus]
MTPRLSRLATAHGTWRAVTATIAAVAAVAGSYAYAGRTPAFVGAPASAFVVETMPAVIVNTTLELLGPLAQPASLVLALGLATGLLAAAILTCLEIEVLADLRYLGAALSIGIVWLVTAALTDATAAALAAAAPAGVVVGVVEYAAAHDPLSVRRDRNVDRTKRATLQAGFGVLSFAGLAAVLGRRRTPDSSVPFLGGGSQPPIGERALLERARRAAFGLPDAPGLVSEIGAFYTVDINTIDPIVERDGWQLSITGDVDAELTIGYDDLREREAEQFYSTLRCVGEDLNDREMDTAVWTGVPVADLLEEAGSNAEYAVARADDGFWNTIRREELERSYLVYGMNGRVLPREHGHPVRLLVPGNWGEVNVKWLTEIELTDEDVDGYWEERDWDGTGEVETVAKLWSVDRGDDGRVTVGGHAYAGLAGVDRVEVSIDGGDSWTDAELSPELEADDAWRQWRHAFEPTADSHEVVVRAIDGDGTVQTDEPSGPKPDGATGWVSRTIEA